MVLKELIYNIIFGVVGVLKELILWASWKKLIFNSLKNFGRVWPS